MYAEIGRLPVQHFWLQQSLKYLGRFVQMDNTRLCKAAFLSDTQHNLGWYINIGQQLRAAQFCVPRHLHELGVPEIQRKLFDKSVTTGMSAAHDNNLEQAYFSV